MYNIKFFRFSMPHASLKTPCGFFLIQRRYLSMTHENKRSDKSLPEGKVIPESIAKCRNATLKRQSNTCQYRNNDRKEAGTKHPNLTKNGDDVLRK